MIKIWSWIYSRGRHAAGRHNPAAGVSAIFEARRARHESEQDLMRVLDQRAEVERVADSLRDATVQERLTEIFESTIKGRRGGGS